MRFLNGELKDYKSSNELIINLLEDLSFVIHPSPFSIPRKKTFFNSNAGFIFALNLIINQYPLRKRPPLSILRNVKQRSG